MKSVNKKMQGKTVFSLALIALSLILIIVWQIFFKSVNYYIFAAAVLVLSMLPFVFGFESKKITAAEISLTAALIALAVVSRAAFYLIPQVKPIAAVVIVSAVCLGAQRGYVIGMFSAFISNFLFGQGIWTPFQMTALGLVGFLAGLLFQFLQKKRVPLSLVGFLLTFFVYGMIADISTILVMYGNKVTLAGIISVYTAGAPFSLVFALTTAVFLFVFGEPFIKKLNRILTKYYILKE